MVNSKNTHTVKLIFFLAFVTRIGLALISSYHPDLNNHIDWGQRLLSYGTKGFYENTIWGFSWPNQPPLSMLLFGGSALISNILLGIIDQINQYISFFPSFLVPYFHEKLPILSVKIPFIFCDLLIGYILYRGSKNRNLRSTSLLWLFNPIVIYNSTIWGQTDSLVNMLVLLGLYLVYKQKEILGIVTIFLSFMFKMSLLIYTPLLILIFYKKQISIKKIIVALAICLCLLTICGFIFSENKDPLTWIWYVYTSKVLTRQGDMLTGNAFNFWAFLYGINFSASTQTTVFGAFPASQIGIVLFTLNYVAIFIKAKSKSFISIPFPSLILVSFCSFLFLTNMHERYLYPIFPLLCFEVVNNNKGKKAYILLTLIHLLNLYNLWYYPTITPIKTLLEFPASVHVLSASLLAIYVYLLIKYLQSDQNQSPTFKPSSSWSST